MKRVTLWVSLILIAGVVIYLMKPSFLGMNGEESAKSPEQTPNVSKMPVSGVLITTKKIDDKITITGSISPNESVELKSETAGKIEGIHFAEGARVRKGALLVSINDDELVAQLEKLKHQKKLLQENEYRQRQLLDREAISQEEYDIASTELSSSQADIQLVMAQLAKTKLRAPFDGIIGLRKISEGSYITSTTPIAYLYNNNPAKVDFSIPSKYSNRVSKGDTVRFITDALEEYRIGRIYAVEPQIDAATRTLSMRAISPNDDNKLLPGQFVKVELIFSSLDNAIMVPTESVIPELGGHKVFVQREGKAAPLVINVGLRTESEVEVTSGLQVNDTLITSGMLQLRPGSEVNVTLTN